MTRPSVGAHSHAFAWASSQHPSGDAESLVLYHGGLVYRSGASEDVGEALLVSGARVRWVGRAADLGTAAVDRRVDLAGRVVLPGLMDAHTHLLSHGLLGQRVDLRGVRSEQDAANQVAAYAAAHPAKRWIVGHGWNESLWPGARSPSRKSLDLAVPDRPVLLSRADGHLVWVNSRALAEAGIGDDTPDPPGGVIDRDQEGHPTGILREKAARLVHDRIPSASLHERLQALRAAQAEAHSLGLVGVHAMEGSEALEALQVLHENGELTLRVLLLPPWGDLEHFRALGLRAGFGSEWLRLGQLKLFADGSLGSHTAWMLAPFEGEPANTGVALHSRAELTEQIRIAHAAGWPCAVHAIGDAANRATLDAFETAPPAGIPLPDRIEHVQIIHPQDIPRLGRLGVVASMQPAHVATDWPLATRLWGERARYSYAWRSLLRAGAALAFGSDAPVEPLNPWTGLQVAVTRRDLEGDPLEGWHPQEALALSEALAAFTEGVARAAGDAQGGHLAPGTRADFVVLEQDPFAMAPEELGLVRPLATVVGGNVVSGRLG